MRRSKWTPSIVPNCTDQAVYIVLDDFGPQGRSYRETDAERSDLESVIDDLMAGIQRSGYGCRFQSRRALVA
jgi:hypothetical protein